MTNFDKNNHRSEIFPLNITNLENSVYYYQESFLIGANRQSSETVVDDSFKKEIFLSPNNIVVIELEKIP